MGDTSVEADLGDLKVQVAEIKAGIAMLLSDKELRETERQRLTDKLETVSVQMAVCNSEISRIAPIVATLEARSAGTETARRLVGAGALAVVGAAGGAIGGFVNWFLALPKH